jgi:hypothetical protein
MSTAGSHLSNSFNRVSKRFSDGVQAQSVPGYKSVTPLVKLAKIIVVALVVIAGILAFDFLILWITSGKFLERLPI